jgi:uncharacterized protein with HEPN domain
MKRFNDRESLAAVSALLIAVQRSIQYVRENSLEDFSKNEMLREAIFYQVFVISEKIGSVDRFFLDRYDYPWYQLTSFRKLMFNEKFDIRLEAVWQMIEKDFPNLEKTLNLMKSNEFANRIS